MVTPIGTARYRSRPSTLFSIQSMSKSFTATAAMFAAQDGLVDLDAPITTYLPDFHVHSIFEEHPEQKMTLRILLSHTAGFPHDPAYGGNTDGKYGAPAYSFEKHIASISDTWLMFPVGTRYSYSNIGIDLAGYILQVRSGMPFIQYVQEKVLDPLGMKDSTLDYLKVRADTYAGDWARRCPLTTPGRLPAAPFGRGVDHRRRIWPATCSSTSIRAPWTGIACCGKTWRRRCTPRLTCLP